MLRRTARLQTSAWLLSLLGAVACSGGGGGGGAPPPVNNEAPFGLTSRETMPPTNFPSTGSNPLALNTITAFPALSFNSPTFLTNAGDGSDRLFVLEKAGRILVFPNRDNVQPNEVTVFLDIRGQVDPEGEQGLLGLAFDPDFGNSGSPNGDEFYVYYSAANPRRSIISRFQVSGNPNVANAGSEQQILVVPQPFSNHNAGMLAFGPDNNLYISIGDGGSGNDPLNSGQDLRSHLGKILRVNPRSGGTYSIPSDNPFFGAGNGILQEIFAYGLRNPWRFSFDRANGFIWCGDVGQGAREEIDIIFAGGNYGWKIFEGSFPANNPGGAAFSNFLPPVIEYDRTQGVSVTGGYVYRGNNPNLTSIMGAYLYADFGSGRVWALVYDTATGSLVSNTQVAMVPNPSSFGEDEAGEVYAVGFGGKIYRFEEQSNPGGGGQIPQTLSDTGLFANTASLIPVPGLYEYDVNAKLWSDAAVKRRWIGLPGNSRIRFSSNLPWTYPLGAILVKHFELELTVGDPSSRRRLETRVFVNGVNGWEAYTYKWNDSQTDADLLPGGATETFDINDPAAPGGVRQQTWSYPSPAQCFQCHTQAAGVILGVQTKQLNRSRLYPNGITDNQLRSFNNIAYFTQNIGQSDQFFALADPFDPGADLSARARAYLDANCAQCHRPGGTAPSTIDFRAEVDLANANLVGVSPANGDLGLTNPARIQPGSKESSVVYERMRVLDSNRMPNIGSNLVHQGALDLIGQWIDQMR